MLGEEPLSLLIVYAGGYTFLVFLAICLATGLYYLAELVEEYAMLTKKIIKWATIVTIVLHVLLWLVDGLPFLCITTGIASHGVYSLLLQSFPFISLTSPAFLLSCGMLGLSHYVWLRHFMSIPYYTVEYVMGFFLLVVWLVPFGFFISLAANESVLPMQSLDARGSGDGGGNYTRGDGKKARGGLLNFMNFVKAKQKDVMPTSGFNAGNKTL